MRASLSDCFVSGSPVVINEIEKGNHLADNTVLFAQSKQTSDRNDYHESDSGGMEILSTWGNFYAL
jgi:hypothetical protein